MEKRRTFTPEEKANIVLEMFQGEKTVSEIVAEHEIHPTVLHRWKTEVIENLPSVFSRRPSETEKIKKQYEAEKEEPLKLIGQLTIEVNWLKKNLLNSTSAGERREMVERNHPELTVKRQSELLEINRTIVYYKPSLQEDQDIELMHKIDEIYTRWPHYGYRRIKVELANMGYIVNKKRVLRLMRRMGIAALGPGPKLSKRNHQHQTYPYLLRGVKAERPDHIWGIDITYIRMRGAFMYLVAIIDWYTR